jgi:glucose-1-phosphate thymidylyltransferase
MKDLHPITLTRSHDDIHSGGFSKKEERDLGLDHGQISLEISTLHELVTLHRAYFAKNLETYKKIFLENNPLYQQLKENVFVHREAAVDESTIFNTKQGIIVIEKEVTVLPFTYLVGPLRINENAIINPHAHISGSYIGTFSKIGGEVGNSVIESYSNKGHYGYIGDSYIGSWVNLGGGTSTSNLKNTYGEVRMSGVRTGEQFLGSIIADYVKTAGNTLIYTGKVIGVNAHIYGTATEDVPSFTNYISGHMMVTLPVDIACTIAERMCARRHIKLTGQQESALRSAYKATENDRIQKGVKEGKLSFQY